MRRLTALPRIAREGWVPAGPEKRVSKRAMLIPKTGHVTDHIPTLMDYSEVLCPPERRALREIVETAEVVRENGHVYLTARVSSATLDSLATFETAREDLELEPDLEEEPDREPEPDRELDHDEEYDFPRERQKYIAGRQERHRTAYSRTRDEAELRKVERQVNALAAKKRKRVKA